MKISKLLLTALIVIAITLGACEEDETITPVTVNFSNTEAGISNSSPQTEVSVIFSRPVPFEGSLVLDINSGPLVYGTSEDFYTSPEASGDQLELFYTQGDESVSFTVFAGDGLNIEQDESITISLVDMESSELERGQNSELIITFSENFVARNGIIEMNAGGADFPLQAYVDLSKISQTTVEKHSWDLGFYNESGMHYVTLNSPAGTMARPLSANDLNEVTAEDTIGFGFDMTIPPPGFDPSVGSIAWIDTPDGKLETTAFGEISSNDSENNVFIIKRGGGRDWKKVRVLQNGEGYTIQYADINATSFESAEILKEEAYNFTFFDLDNGITEVEPEKVSWDIMYSTYTEVLNLGAPGLDIPYLFNDYIIINRHEVKVATVMISDVPFENFTETNIENLDFKKEINAIGSTWRQGGGPGQAPSLLEDRYYILNDFEGNIYKLMFTRLTSTSGERGYPEFKFELVD